MAITTNGSGGGNIIQNCTGQGNDSLWSQNGTSIYYNNGNVGVGTATPANSFDVRLAGANNGDIITVGNMVAGPYGHLSAPLPNHFEVRADVADTLGLGSNNVVHMFMDLAGNVGIGTVTPGSPLDVVGNINVTTCSGCSVVAEMMPVEGPFEEGIAVCIAGRSGKISRCTDDGALNAVGMTTTHAEQLLRLGCGDSAKNGNHLNLGGATGKEWKSVAACKGWMPVALSGLHEFAQVECFRHDGSALRYGDRLITSGQHPGLLRPLGPRDRGGDAVLGKAITVCASGLETGTVHVQMK
jgi:hypothetical protein